MVLLREAGPCEVEAVELRPVHYPVYNFAVDQLKCYAVGEQQILVHNTNGLELGPDDVLVRRGTSRESAARLARQAQAAEDAGLGHGVSVTIPESNARLARNPLDAVTAKLQEIQDAGFGVQHTPTRSDPFHHTILLPKPVTNAIAYLFNKVFGRI